MTTTRVSWSGIDWRHTGRCVALSILFAGALYSLGSWLFGWYGQDLEFMRTSRTSGYFPFGIQPLYLLLVQAYCNLGTRKPWHILPLFLYAGAVLFGTFAWSGPGDQAKVAENLQMVRICLIGGLLVLNAMLCRIGMSLIPAPVKAEVPRQLKFDF